MKTPITGATPIRDGQFVIALSAHKAPRMYVHKVRYPTAAAAAHMAEKIAAAGRISLANWAQCDLAHFVLTGNLKETHA